MRELLSTNQEVLQKLEALEKKDLEHDEKLLLIFNYLKQLEQTNLEEQKFKNRKKVGFKQGENKN